MNRTYKFFLILLVFSSSLSWASEHEEALFTAVITNDLDLMQHLVRSGVGVDINARYYSNRSALHIAAEHGYTSIVKFLLEISANPNTKTYLWETPLHCASRTGSAEIAELLIAYGARVNEKDWRDITPFEIAAKYQHWDVVKILIHHGANLKFRNKEDKSGYDLIFERAKGNMQSVLEIAQEFGISNADLLNYISWETSNCYIFDDCYSNATFNPFIPRFRGLFNELCGEF